MKNITNEITILGQKFTVNKAVDSEIPYIIGVSVSDREGNASCIAITDPVSMVVVAIYKSLFIRVEDLECMLVDLVKNFIPNSTICVIRNSTGLSLLRSIIKSIKDNVFYEKKECDSIKYYGVGVMETHRSVDLNTVLSLPNVDKDDVLALSAATYVYNKKKINNVSDTKEANWEGYPTKNQSFIDMAEYLKGKGIKNYDFMLELKNQDLFGVDPYSTDLSNEIKDAILEECRENPWYFFREVILVGNINEVKSPFELNRGNTAMIWLFFKGIDTLTYLSRDNHKITTGLAILTYLMAFDKGNRAVIGAPKPYNSMSLLTKMRSLYETLPPYMQTERDYMYNSSEEVSIQYTHINTKVSTYRSYKTKSEAESVARGINTPVQFFDDIDSIEHFDKFYKYSQRPFITIKNDDKSNGRYSARIMTSIPGDLSTDSAQFANWLFKSATLFSENMYDLTDDDLIVFINSVGNLRLVAINMDYLKLGKSQEWYKEQCERLNNDEDAIRRELFLERYEGSVNDKISDKEPEEFNNTTIIEFTTSKTIKDKLNQIAKREGVDVNMLINQMVALEIGKFDN